MVLWPNPWDWPKKLQNLRLSVKPLILQKRVTAAATPEEAQAKPAKSPTKLKAARC